MTMEERPQLDSKDQEVVLSAHEAYGRGDYEEGLRLLKQTNQVLPAITMNRCLCQFHVDKDVGKLVAGLKNINHLSELQRLMVDYNQALALARHDGKYHQAIDILEKRKKIVQDLTGNKTIDDKFVVQLNLLLAIVYLESRKNPSQALSILNSLTEKVEPTRIQRLKARCYLQMGCAKTAKKELKSFSGDPVVRAHMELLREHTKKAVKIFATCPDSESVQYKNNESLLLYGSGKKCSAIFQLSQLLKDNPKSPHATDVFYNLAIMHLMTGNADGAKNLMKQIIPSFKYNSRLWFRMGEAILYHHVKDFLKDWDKLRHRQDLLRAFSSNSNGHEWSKKIECNFNKHRPIEARVLHAARTCFMNALHVVNDESSSTSNMFYPSTVSSLEEVNRFKVALNLSLSFVNLTAGDFSAAHDFSRAAICLSPKGHQRILANLYAGQAHLGMDRPEAINHFNPTIIGEEMAIPVNEESPDWDQSVHESVATWYPNTAKIVLTYNQAVVTTMKGDFERALDILKPILPSANDSSVIPVQMTQLIMFLYLRLGHLDSAKSLLSQYMPKY